MRMLLGFCLLTTVALSGTSLAGQEIAMTKSTETKFGGAMDFIMRLMGSGGPQTQKLSISGPAATVRSDDFEDAVLTNSQITNFSTGDIHVIDHQDESFFTFNLNDLFATGPFRTGALQPPSDAQNQEPEQTEHQGAEYEIKVNVDRRDGRYRFQEWDAEAVLLTITAIPKKAPEGQSIDSMPTFVMASEIWSADDFPGNDVMEELSREAAATLRGATGLDGDAMAQAFQLNPQFADAFEQNQSELEKIDNMPLKQISVFVALSPGAEFNADSALFGSMGEVKLDVAGAVASAAASSVRGRLGRVGGLGRRGNDNQETPAGPPPTQILMFRVIEQVIDFQNELAVDWDSVPSTYEEKPNPLQARPN